MTSIKREFFNGVLFTAIGKYSYVFINFLITAILARILTPADFGIVAIATVIINFFSMLSDMGIGPAIVQNKELEIKDLKDIFSLTFYIGAILSLIFFFSAPFFSKYYKNEQLLSVVQLFSVAIFFHCIDIVPHSLLVKEKKFSFIAYSNVIVQILCGVVSIFAAYLGFGVYSLLVQPILSSILIFAVDVSQHWVKPSFRMQKESIEKIFSYSLFQFLFSFINYFSRNLDKLVVGRVFGVSDLGYYEKSYRLMMLPVGNLSHVITPAIQPIFSEFQNDKILLYKRSVRIMKLFVFLGFPISVFLYFCSSEIILLSFGEQWYGAIPVFQILSLSVGFQMIYSPQGAFFQSANAVKEMFYCGLATAIFNILAVIFGCLIYKNIEVLSWLIVISYILAFIVTYFIMIKRVFTSSFRIFLKIFIQPLELSLLLTIALLLFNFIAPEMSIILSLIIKISISIFIVGVFELSTKSITKLLK